VFGDDEHDINIFFDLWQNDFTCAAADTYGNICLIDESIEIGAAAETAAMGFLVPVGSLNGRDCGMIYAVAVDSPFRGRGYGAEITKSLIKTAEEKETAVVLKPAERSLFKYYTEKTSLKPSFRGIQASVWGIEKIAPRPIHSANTAEYNAAREIALADIEHITYNEKTLEWFLALGGGFYIGDGICAAAEKRPGQVFCQELISEDQIRAIKSVGAALSRSHITARFHDSSSEPFAMSNVPSSGWFGLTFE